MDKYYLFLDESGHHGLKKINQEFPIFLLCGCLISKGNYQKFEKDIDNLKIKYFNDKEIVLHSTDIRKWQNNFKILGNIKLRNEFYKDLDDILNKTEFTIISSAVIKEEYVKTYGPQTVNPYEISLASILDRSILFSDNIGCKNITVIAESRGRREDSQLHDQYQLILSNGTALNKSLKFKKLFTDIDFKKKKDNIVGTQLCDLVAYPVSTKILYPDRVNMAFSIIEDKLFRQFPNGDYINYGLKIFP